MSCRRGKLACKFKRPTRSRRTRFGLLEPLTLDHRHNGETASGAQVAQPTDGPWQLLYVRGMNYG